MSALRTLLHQLRTDLRRFRFSIAMLILVNLLAVVAERLTLPGRMDDLLFNLLRLGQIVLFPLMVLRLFLADSIVDDGAHWRTRPIRSGVLVGAKLVYVVLALWAPALVCYGAGWLYDGFTAGQLAAASMEITLYIGAAAGLGAAIASVSAGYWRAWGVAAVLLGVFVASALVGRVIPFRDPSRWWEVSTVQQMVMVYATLFVTGLGACAFAYLLRRPRWAYLWLIPVGGILFWLPSPRSTDIEIEGPRPGIELAQPLDDGSPEYILAGNLAVRGLPDDTVALPAAGELIFQGRDASTAVFEVNRQAHRHEWFARAVARLEPLLRGRFPSLELQADAWNASRIINVNQTKLVRENEPGRLQGHMAYLLVKLTAAGSAPLSEKMDFREGGHSLRVLQEPGSASGSGLKYAFLQRDPALLFSCEMVDRYGPRGQSWTHWLLLVEFGGSGEVFGIPATPDFYVGGLLPIERKRSGRFQVPVPAGVDVRSSPPIVHAFRVSAVSAHDQSVAWDNHRVHIALDRPRETGEATEKATASDTGTGYRSVTDLGRFRGYDSRLNSTEQRALKQRLEGLLAEDVPGALAGAPWRGEVHRMLVRALPKRLQESHQPALRAALERDPRLIDLVEAAGWGPAFADVVVKRLARRDPLTESAFIRIAARYQDPTLYEDLRWQFIYGRQMGKESMYAALESLAGFDAPAVLNAAWNRARLTGREEPLRRLALEHGLPGALAVCLRGLYWDGEVEKVSYSRFAGDLMKATEFNGSLEEFYSWIQENAERLQYDPVTRRYRVEKRMLPEQE